MSTIFFLTIVKLQNKDKDSQILNRSKSDINDLSKYKRLLKKVTKKIDKWHEDQKNAIMFERDEDYIE